MAAFKDCNWMLPAFFSGIVEEDMALVGTYADVMEIRMSSRKWKGLMERCRDATRRRLTGNTILVTPISRHGLRTGKCSDIQFSYKRHSIITWMRSCAPFPTGSTIGDVRSCVERISWC